MRLLFLLACCSCASAGWFGGDAEQQPPPPPPAHGPVQWGIMGTAKIARKMAWAIEQAENSVLTAVASRSIDRAVKFTAEHTQSMGHARFYGSYEELIADTLVEAVYIPLPTALMKPWVLKACNAQKHVLADKPFGSAADVAEMAAACARNGRQFMDATMFVHNRREEELQRQIAGGVIGEVRRVKAAFTYTGLAPDNIRLDGTLEPMAALGDVGWYAIRASLLALPDAKPIGAQCFGLNNQGAKDMMGAISFEGGAVAMIEAAFGVANRQKLEIIGSEKTIEIPDFAIPNDPMTSFTVRQLHKGVFDTSAEELPYHFENSYQTVAMIRRFSYIAGAGNALLEPVWGEWSVRTMAVLDACMASIAKGGAQVSIVIPSITPQLVPPPPPPLPPPSPPHVAKPAESNFLHSRGAAAGAAADGAEADAVKVGAAARGPGVPPNQHPLTAGGEL